MPLAPGDRLGAYEVLTLIGAGGMGEVYRARDTKLNRDVALKILPEAFALDPDRLARFKREAQVLASLNHPNIAIIHGLEHADGAHALVMELIEGEDLAQRIVRGAIPLDDALPIARQIAEALEAAHEQGVIHRDLKPSNIKMRTDGTVKVLDFGLAKALSPDGSAVAASGLSQSPTITSPANMTGVGVLLGTAAYMAPEQARGKAVDKRADIWAFGCVLYEMLAGKRAFEGEDVSDTLAEVLKRDPDWRALPPATPESIQRLLRRCLAKDRKARMSDASVARLDIDEALTALAAPPLAASTPQRKRVRLLAPTISGIVAAGLAGVAVWMLRPGPAPRPATRFEIQLPPNAQFSATAVNAVALSRDGRRIVYNAVRDGVTQLYVRSLDRLDAVPIRGSETYIGSVFLSPDGNWVGYNDTTDGSFKKIRLEGGPPATICATRTGGGGFRGASWGSNGTVVFSTIGWAAGLMRVPDAGGTPQPLTNPEGEVHARPHFLPDGQALLFTIQRPGMPVRIAVLELETGDQHELLDGDAPHFASGYLVFRRGTALWAAPFDPRRRVTLGDAVPLVEGVQAAWFDIADDGTLVYSPGGPAQATDRTLLWVDRHGTELPLKAPGRAYVYPRLSPDGTRIALDVRDQQNDIWVWHVARETLTRLTSDPGLDRFPVWSPDGKRIAYSLESAGYNLFWQAADGTGSVERLGKSPETQTPSSFSPDGQALLFGTGGGDIEILALGGERGAKSLLKTSFGERNPEVSPDGRWLAYESNESRRFEIYVRPFPDVNGGRWQISTVGGTQPLWGPNGRELFYRTPDGSLMRVPIAVTDGFSAASPAKLWEKVYFSGGGLQGRTYDISQDGQRLLMIKAGADAPENPARLVVVENWFEELKARAPAR